MRFLWSADAGGPSRRRQLRRPARERGARTRRAQGRHLPLPSLAGCASLLIEAGHPEEARQLGEELLDEKGAISSRASVELALVASERGRVDDVAEVVERGARTKWTDAASALLQGDVVRTAEIHHETGQAELESLTRLRAAHGLMAEGRRAEGDEQLQRSLAFYRSAAATRYVSQAERLLEDLSEVSA